MTPRPGPKIAAVDQIITKVTLSVEGAAAAEDAVIALAPATNAFISAAGRGTSSRGYVRSRKGVTSYRRSVCADAAAQAVKTLIYEIGHALLHSDELPRSKEVAEVEVESVAYIVCDAIGLDSGDYSFRYVATGARVVQCARK